MPEKVRYEIDLSSSPPPDGDELPDIRAVHDSDLECLAVLMLDAYVGTIDYDDEDIDDARGEIRAFLDDDNSLLDRSLVQERSGTCLSAVLVSMSSGRPFISYVMTTPSQKARGLARAVTGSALRRLAADGHETVVLYITEGNKESERLFQSLGAERRLSASGSP